MSDSKPHRLCLTRFLGQRIRVGDAVVFVDKIETKRGAPRLHFVIEAPLEVRVLREEIEDDGRQRGES